jgi:SAM-dependent methyltransferase
MATHFNERYYQNNYRNYDTHSPKHKLNFYNKEIDLFLNPLIEKPKIHDIGCAYGNFLINLDSRFIKFGSDISEFAIECAKKKVLNKNDSISFELIKDSLPFSSINFDVITAFDVLEHMPHLESSMELIYKQLNCNGLFIFVVPVYDGLTGPIVKILDKDPTHLHKWDRNKWINLVSEKFHILEWKGIFRYNLFGKLYIHFPTFLFRNHSPALLVICRKK